MAARPDVDANRNHAGAFRHLVGRLFVGEDHAGTSDAHEAAVELMQRIGHDGRVEHVFHSQLSSVLCERVVVSITVVAYCDLGQRFAEGGIAFPEDLPVPLGHDRVVAGIDVTQGGLMIFVGRARDEVVAFIRGHFVHAFPAEGQGTWRVTRCNRLESFPDRAAARGSAGFDADVAERIQSEPVMDYGLAQELITEVIGEVSVVAGVNETFEFSRFHAEEHRRHPEGIDAKFLGAFRGEGASELRHASGHEIHRLGQFRYAQLGFTESNQGLLLSH